MVSEVSTETDDGRGSAEVARVCNPFQGGEREADDFLAVFTTLCTTTRL